MPWQAGHKSAFFKVGLPYMVLAGGYILISSRLADMVSDDHATFAQVEILKGLAFVAVTGILVTLLTGSLLARAMMHERSLAQETAQRTGVYEALPGPVFALDAEGRLVSWNSHVLRATGLDAEQMAGRKAEDFILPEDRAAIRDGIRHVLTKGETRIIPGRLMRADGDAVPFLWSGAPIFGEDGAIQGAIGFGQDISVERRTADSLRARLKETERLLFQTVGAIARAMEARDPYTAGHQAKVAQLAVQISRRLGLPPDRLKGLELAAEVHDIGKLAVPADLLTLPRRLSDIEMAVVRTHVDWGYRILSGIDFPWPVAEIVRQHHERLDGSGYPQGLSGDAILLESRILAVADVVDSMMSHRPYRGGLGQEAALDELRRGVGSAYDPAAAQACLDVFAEGFAFREPRAATITPAA